MKKLLVLTLVLGLASLASAGLSLVGGTQIDVMGADNAEGAVSFLVTSGGTLDGGALVYGGSLAAITPGLEADGELVGGLEAINGLAVSQVYLLEFFDGSSSPAAADGLLATFQGVSIPVDAYLASADDLSMIGSVVSIVPEPATMALLGLGALVLRRKK